MPLPDYVLAAMESQPTKQPAISGGGLPDYVQAAIQPEAVEPEPIVAPETVDVLPKQRPTAFLPTGEALTQEERQRRAGDIVPTKEEVAGVIRPTIEAVGLAGGATIS